MIISHQEYITDLVAIMDTQVVFTRAINPGNAAVFPWMSGLANKFDNFQIIDL